MKGKGLNQQQNKSQREIHPSSGWLQGAAVREVPGKEVESPVVGESGLNRSFVNVPVHGGGLPVVQRKLTKKASPEPGGRENNTGLPDNLKSGIENLSGYSLDNVKVHYNSNKPSQLQAHAYAQGTDIHVASGQEKHLPHEAWHVVQQMQGRVKPTMQTKGVAINDDRALEREADMMGVKATSVNIPEVVAQRKLQEMANNSPQAQRAAQLQSIANNHSSQQPQPIQKKGNNRGLPVIQLAVGQQGLQNIKDSIFKGNKAAQIIAQDIYNVDAPHDGDFTQNTREKIKKSAETMGYESDYAIRLAWNVPFRKDDIEGETNWVDGGHPRQVESFKYMDTLNDPRGEVVSKHQLDFENIYSATGKATFKYNARNPALANFYASDVVEKQRDYIESHPVLQGGGNVKTVVRENVQSVNGGEWRNRHPEWGAMTPQALQDFLKKTDNGKSTVNMFRGQFQVVAGEVIKYDGGPEWSAKLRLNPI